MYQLTYINHLGTLVCLSSTNARAISQLAHTLRRAGIQARTWVFIAKGVPALVS